MTIQCSCYGRLGSDPRSIETQSGKPMAVASIACDVGDSSEEPEPLWLGIVCFGGKAERLLQHQKGETLSAYGRLQRRTYTDRHGAEREQLQVIVDGLVSARTVRPSGGKKKATESDDKTAERASERELFNDDIPF